MAKMVSPAGEMDMTFLGVSGEKDQMVVRSKFGAWDAKIYFSPDELVHLLKLMLNSSFVLFLLRFPFILIGSKLSR